jgi:hypothetical protein
LFKLNQTIVPIDQSRRSSVSRLETLVEQTERLPPHAELIFRLLIGATKISTDGEHSVLRPLWANDAMHRSYAMLRLLVQKAERYRGCSMTGAVNAIDFQLARSLVDAYTSLVGEGETTLVPCSVPLREIVVNLVELLGSGVAVSTVIDRVMLPAYKRRALVLAASELVLNALTHGFPDDLGAARIAVSLRQLGRTRACLQVRDNGAGFTRGIPNVDCGIAGSLASLVQTDLVYHRSTDWTTAEILFPLELENGTITDQRRLRRIAPPSRTVTARPRTIHPAALGTSNIPTSALPGAGEPRAASLVIQEFPPCHTVDARSPAP